MLFSANLPLALNSPSGGTADLRLRTIFGDARLFCDNVQLARSGRLLRIGLPL